MLQNVGGSEWVLSQNRLGAWLGKDCMNLVTVISEYTQVPVTLSTETRENQPESTNQTFEDASAE